MGRARADGLGANFHCRARQSTDEVSVIGEQRRVQSRLNRHIHQLSRRNRVVGSNLTYDAHGLAEQVEARHRRTLIGRLRVRNRPRSDCQEFATVSS